MNSWLVFGLKPLNFILVLPLVLNRLDTPEVAVYYLFAAAWMLMMMVSYGLNSSFIRILGYLLNGASPGDLVDGYGRDVIRSDLPPKGEHRVTSGYFKMMGRVYFGVGVLASVVALLIFTPLLIRPLSKLDNPSAAWFAWGSLLILAPIALFTNTYASYLFGANAITKLRRTEFLAGVGSIVASCICLLFYPNLAVLMLAMHLWNPVKLVLLSRVSRELSSEVDVSNPLCGHAEYRLFSAVWPSAWRVSIGVMLNQGMLQASSLMLAQLASVSTIASYGLTVSLVSAISEFSKAPMVSRMPVLVKLKVSGDLKALQESCSRSMAGSYWAFAVGVSCLILFGQVAVKFISPNVSLAPQPFVLLMAIACYLDRFSAMHQQIYETSNRIIMHITSLVYSVIYLSVVFFSIHALGIYAFALAAIFGQLIFVAAVSCHRSYKVLEVSSWAYERKVSVLPLIAIFSCYAIAQSF